MQVVDGQQTPVGHRNDAFDGVALQDLLNGGLERGYLGRVAFEYLVVKRQSVSCLHHSEHDLARHHPLFGHAELAHVIGLLGKPFSADGRHVIEHHRQVLVHQGAKQPGQDLVHRALLIDQRIHGAQQVLVFNGIALHARQTHGLEPAQRAQFRIRIAQAVEDHDTQ